MNCYNLTISRYVTKLLFNWKCFLVLVVYDLVAIVRTSTKMAFSFSHSTEIVGFSAVEDKLHGTIIVCLLDTGELVTRITKYVFKCEISL